jgi:hypothetical protein
VRLVNGFVVQPGMSFDVVMGTLSGTVATYNLPPGLTYWQSDAFIRIWPE